MEPYIGDAGVIILLIVSLLYFNWDHLFHE